MREIRTLRSMWRGLETWLDREVSRPKPARQSPTLPTWRGLETWLRSEFFDLAGAPVLDPTTLQIDELDEISGDQQLALV